MTRWLGASQWKQRGLRLADVSQHVCRQLAWHARQEHRVPRLRATTPGQVTPPPRHFALFTGLSRIFKVFDAKLKVTRGCLALC